MISWGGRNEHARALVKNSDIRSLRYRHRLLHLACLRLQTGIRHRSIAGASRHRGGVDRGGPWISRRSHRE